jgi:outer membrane protein OmpA-like peptidoglycan-associated protein
MSTDSLLTYVQKIQRTNATLQNRQDSISRIIATYRNNRTAIYNRIIQTMGSDLKNWGAQIDPETLTIRFNGAQTKFAPGSDALSPGFRKVLQEFIPKLFKIVVDPKLSQDIVELKIEGHAYLSDQSYETILAGSQNRARNVLLFIRGTSAYRQLDANQKKDLDFKMTATGMGFNRMIDQNGKFVKYSKTSICPECSRRVEFSILTSSDKVVYQLEKKF